MATTLPTESAAKPLPFTSGGSVLGFMPAPTLAWNSFLGGSGYDSTLGKIPGVGIAVDANGNLYVTGVSESTWGDPIRPWAGNGDAFVAKLDKNGALLWNTFLGGNATDSGSGIAVDASGNVYVTGSSAGTWGDPPPGAGTGDVFVAKLDTNGALLWNSFLGGDYGFGITIDASGNVFVTGSSYATWGNPIRPYSGYRDAFVAKLDTGGALLWNSFLGGTTYDEGKGIAVDSNGNVFVAGHSYGSWGDPIGPWAESWDGFVAKLDTDGNLTWNTFFGGAGFDWSWGIAADANNNVVITGRSDGTWGDPINPWVRSYDAFVTKFTGTPPIAYDQALIARKNTAKVITLSATDADGDALTFSVVTSPAHGILSGTAPNLTYQPAATFIGADSFTFKATDGSLESNIALVSITVTDDMTPPTGSTLINNGADWAKTRAVTLYLSATDTGGSGIDAMRFANSGGTTSAWEPFQTTKAWMLSSGAGTKTVWVQFRDKAGNLSDADPVKAGAQSYKDTIRYTGR